MTNGDGSFKGAVPLGDKIPMVSCIWHTTEMEHPPGAPPCQWDSGASQMVMPMGLLLQWITLTLTNVLARLGEIQVTLEALDATLDE